MVFDKRLRGQLNLEDPGMGVMLKENFISYLDWSFINMGAFFKISTPTTGIYGGRKDVLKRKKQYGVTDGTVWEGHRSNWVWETGVFPRAEPTRISGVYINDTFYATGNTTYPFNIDYLNGRIVFDNAIPNTGTVVVEYADKHVMVTPSDGIPFLRQIQENSFRIDNPTFNFFGSGDWLTNSEQRLQMPLVGVKVVSNRDHSGYELGGGLDVKSDIVFYVFGEEEWRVQNLCDIIAEENDRGILLFDPNKVGASGTYPFDSNNYLVENALPSGMYPNMIDNFQYNDGTCFIESANVQSIKELNPGIWMGVTKMRVAVPRKNL